MADKTIIAWAHSTFNPWIGCTKVHAGCAHCYAEADFDKKKGRVKWGPAGTRSKTSESNWQLPHKWNREAEKAGERRRVFCASLADVFEQWDGPIVDHKGLVLLVNTINGKRDRIEADYIPKLSPKVAAEWRQLTMDDMRAELFAIIDATPWLDWMLLTKRPENVRRMWPLIDSKGRANGLLKHRSNVWLGTSVSNQETHDKQWPELAKCRDLAPVLFFSGEPLLAPIKGRAYCPSCDKMLLGSLSRACGTCHDTTVRPDWIIVGGESGQGYRPMDHAWARDIRDQCKASKIAFFFKQSAAPRTEMGIELDGQIIREFPKSGAGLPGMQKSLI